MNTIRTFIAIDTPAEFKPEISNLQQQLIQSHADVRWEHENKFHITLKFLGDVKEKILPGLLTHLDTILSEYSPLHLTYRGVGCFPNLRYPKIVWVGAENNDGKLLELRTTIEDELISFGFQREKNQFTPHITIGRVRSERGTQDLISTLEKLTLEPRTFLITEIVVMKSVLKPSGSEYEPLSIIHLSK